MSRHDASSADHDSGTIPARPRRKSRTAKAMRNFYGAPALRRAMPGPGRRSAQLYDPVTGRKLPRP